jgi:uncharacterized protein YeaC (DUF1315 family)
MIKTNKDFTFEDKNFHKEVTDKHQIILMDTNRSVHSYFEDISNKSPLGYKKTSPYTIGLDGTIYEHYDSHYYSNIFHQEVDKKLLPIYLENEGPLKFDGKKKKFINWIGDIYTRSKDSVSVTKWHGGLFWPTYGEEQMDSLAKLIIMLCDKHNISKRVAYVDYDHDMIDNFLGVTSRSDYYPLYTDINPNFGKKRLIKKIEEYEKSH